MSKSRSIQTKFIAAILTCVLLTSTVVGGTGILTTQKVAHEASEKTMNLMCAENAGTLDAMLSRILQSVNILAEYASEEMGKLEQGGHWEVMDSIGRMDDAVINVAVNTEGALSAYLRFLPEETTVSPGILRARETRDGEFLSLPAESYPGWDQITVSGEETVWIDPRKSEKLNTRIVSCRAPVRREGRLVAVAGIDIDFEAIENVAKNISIYDTGYAFLVDRQGGVLYHREYLYGEDMSLADADLADVVKELGKGSSEDNLYSYQFNGENKQLAYRTLQNGMILVLTVPTREVNSSGNALLLKNVITVLGFSIAAIVLTVISTHRIIRPLRELDLAARKIAAGDLTVEITTKSDDEVGMLAESLRKSVEHMKQHVGILNGLAYRDSLTGVKNRTAYQEAADKLDLRIREEKPRFGLVVIDVNYLKRTNDAYGHDIGDLLITDGCKAVCRTFAHSPVYRIGGDEFVVLLENDDLERRDELVKVLEKSVEQHNLEASEKVQLSLSKGLAVYDPEQDADFSDVFKRADAMMYENKKEIKVRDGVVGR